MELVTQNNGFTLKQNGKALLIHTPENPCLFIGFGEADIEMYRGNFDIQDNLKTKVPLVYADICKKESGWEITFSSCDGAYRFLLTIRQEQGRIRLLGHSTFGDANRIWVKIPAQRDEAVYGGGEQFSHFNLRRRRFPIWTSEQGVGRNKSTMMTRLADVQDKAGGDYYWTFFPQPTFLSSAGYYCHVEDTCYSVLDFTHEDFHELYLWQGQFSIVIEQGGDYKALVGRLTALLGRQPVLPDWAVEGAWLGIQGGQEVVDEKLLAMQRAGAKVSAVWCQDWVGIRMTSFGKRLMWNWRYHPAYYPDLPKHIARWNAQGVRFLGYIAPYVCEEGDLFQYAAQNGLLVRNRDNDVYRVDFGEFYCGVVDLTNPRAFEWYKGVIKNNLIGIGLSGWMADFGEYLPTDCVLYSGEDPVLLHNRWPAIWARCNYEAVAETGNIGKIVYFMRAGAAGSQGLCPLMWAGDQNVDWSIDDGLASVIPAALSLGMSGCGLHTSDIGGYTTMFHAKRTKELFMRWAEFCAFTPVMRTHEGNRPNDNWQFDSDEETKRHFAWCTQLHVILKPYLMSLMQENTACGVPVMRPMCMEYPQDRAAQDLQYQYLLGPDLLIAPVYEEHARQVAVYIPEDGWRRLWDAEEVPAGYGIYDAPLGAPAVFYKEGSPFEEVFAAVRGLGAFTGGSRCP